MNILQQLIDKDIQLVDEDMLAKITDKHLLAQITNQDILEQITILNMERNKKIDALNMRQRMLNAERQAIYAEYEEKISVYQKLLDSLNDRSSEKSHP